MHFTEFRQGYETVLPFTRRLDRHGNLREKTAFETFLKFLAFFSKKNDTFAFLNLFNVKIKNEQIYE